VTGREERVWNERGRREYLVESNSYMRRLEKRERERERERVVENP